MPPKQVGRPRGRPAAAKKRKLEAAGDEPKVAKRGPGRPPKKKPVLVAAEPAPEPVGEPQPAVDPETTIFLQLLEDDTRRLPPPPPPLPKRRGSAKSPPEKRVVEFQLPFKEAEIKSLEERQWVRRPPPFGRISRCVYVSTTMPIADFPVHKCTCCEETHKSMTKRTTMMASAKAQKELETNGAHAGVDKESEAEDVVYCGEGCYNRMLFISCSDETCSAPDPSMCSNRAIKRRELKSVRVEYIPGPGFGLIANEKINAGEFIIEYVGEVIDDSECERRLIQYRDNGEVNFYMMELEKNIVIDAKYRSNDSRFINHCCDPNSVTQKWNVDGIQRIGIFARRNIAPNEEITIDYNFSHFGEAADCKCGSTACTGKMGLKRSKLSSFNPRVVGTAKAKKQVPVDEKPPELKRPVHLTSLALLKSSQMDESWMDYYGFKTRRLFLSHRPRRQKKSKWNKRIPSSSSINPDRIHRLIDRVKGKQIYIKSDQNDLNEDACFRCGLAGELICCDGCPAAFHLNCTNLAMVPPDGIPWFCSECTNPRHLQKASETSDAGLIAANGTRSSNRAKHTDYASRHLRTHGAPQIPSLKKIFHSSVPHAKRRYKKRHKATDRSYRELEHMPLPVWNESDESGAEQ
ncbi:putative histone-lysine N-methyltransferase [Phytophthora cinnamomi]|uniref:putative histone-lysine N-methyltransferase n=1 Tax=Phytophthora cinnamomi TaxID=4785 RepID=UPI003559A618|nr:putative histone-lysine N-methyltransferase [Phytophthora cinnamomi]